MRDAAIVSSSHLGSGGDLDGLRASFEVFTRVTSDLEAAYRSLEGRARRVERQALAANRDLSGKVREISRFAREVDGILAALPSGVVVTDSQRSIQRVNAMAERLLGRPAVELIGRPAQVILGPDKDALLLVGDESIALGEVRERRVTCLDGGVRHLSSSISVLPSGGFVETLSDRTEVHHLRSQVHRLDMLAALGEMAAGVAHEIRNPMNGVEGFAGLLERALAPERELQRERLLHYTGRIRQGVREVNSIITDLLAWARPERLVLECVSLSDLFSQAVEDSIDANDHPGAATVTVRSTCPDRQVSVDRLKLRQVLSNLVRNAREAVGKNGTVVLSSEQARGEVQIHVDDDGRGIDPEILPRLFTPFATTKASGTGLGLAIARKLVDLHGGRLSAGTSRLGGARFSLTLPCNEAAS